MSIQKWKLLLKSHPKEYKVIMWHFVNVIFPFLLSIRVTYFSYKAQNARYLNLQHTGFHVI
jgi:hypothetical protein